MQNYTQDYLNKIRSQTREMKGYVTFNGDSTKILAGNNGLVSLKVHQSAMDDERYCIGSVCSSYCEMTFFNNGLPSGVSLANSYFDAYIGIVMGVVNQVNLEQYTCMGRFYITEISRGKETTQVVGYDVTSRLAKDYAPTVTKTAQGYLVMDILNDIIDQCGVNNGTHFTDVGNNVYVQQIFEGTCKEQWGWLMSLCNSDGKCYFGSRTDLGMIEGRGYTDGSTVYDSYPALDDAVIYLDGYSDGDDFTVNSLTTGTDDSPIVIGNGVGINAPNPYMTETQATAIYNTLHGVTFTPMNLHFRGDMMIDLFDSLKVTQDGTDHRCVVMSIETTFNGGLEQTIECWGDSEEYYAMSSGRMNTIESKVSTNSTLLQEMAQSIETARGGVITQVLDTDGTWKELVIANSQDLSQATSVWRFNIAGLAHSTSYTGGTYSFALDDQGRIIANLIQTGVLQDALGKNSWNLDTGAFRITEGSINITTASETYDVITLINDTWVNSLSPLELKTFNTNTKYAFRIQAGGIFGYSDYVDGTGGTIRTRINAGSIRLHDSDGKQKVYLSDTGIIQLNDSNGNIRILENALSAGGVISVYGGASGSPIEMANMQAQTYGGVVSVKNPSGQERAGINVTSNDSGAIYVNNSNGIGVATMRGNSGFTLTHWSNGTGYGIAQIWENSYGATLKLGDLSGNDRVRAEVSSSGNGDLSLYASNNVKRTDISALNIYQYNASGTQTMRLDGTNGRIYPLGSSDYIHDFIIAEGYTSPWYWRKWYSGYAEAWARVAHTMSFSQAWGSVYTADIAPEAYPFSFRDGTQPIEQVSAVGAKSGTDNSCWLCNYGGQTGPTHLQTGKYQAIRPVRGSATIRIAYYVRGLL